MKIKFKVERGSNGGIAEPERSEDVMATGSESSIEQKKYQTPDSVSI